MFSSFGESFQLGVDCVAALDEGRYIIFGWHMTPRGYPAELSFAARDGRMGRVEYISRHARPDVIPADPGAAIVGGFSLVVLAPYASRGLIMTITAGDASGHADLANASMTDLFRATEERDWGVTFGLLKECMERPDVLPLLHYQYRPFGAFAGWIARLPLIQGGGENISIVAQVAAAASPAGEVALDLRFIGRSRATVGLEVLAVTRLRSDDGGPDRIALLPLQDVVTRHIPGASALYGRFDWAHVPHLRSVDLIVQITFDAERVWLRCQPEMATVPAFLDMMSAATANHQGGNALLQAAMDRRASLAQALLQAEHDRGADEAAGTETPGLPELALIGVDDEGAARLLHLLAPELEANSSAILLQGAAAEMAGQMFLRRGKVPVTVALEPGAVLSQADVIGTARIIAVDVPSLAAASIEGNLAGFLGNRRRGGMGRLLLLHSLAGPTASLGESLTRHARMMDNPDQPWFPIAVNWKTSLGAEWVNEHLEAIWRYAPATLPAPSETQPGETQPGETQPAVAAEVGA
jgi:hypothetical protein